MTIDVAVVGAGPYGLSIASHLAAHGIEHRVFGEPMQTWCTLMPQGMFLKSDGFASNLYTPGHGFSLSAYCTSRGIPYADVGLPTPRAVFTDYGKAFQRLFVPHLEPVDVVALEAGEKGFRLTLGNQDTLTARRVVLAVGISHFAYIPPKLAALPKAVVSHSSEQPDLSVFVGREVLVLGAGASALDCVALLVSAGASVTLVARAPVIDFHSGPLDPRRSLLDRLRRPDSGLGPGWRSRLCTDAPLVFHAMPEWFRLPVVRKHLGPAPGWWTRSMVEGRAPLHLGQQVHAATEQRGRIRLELIGPEATRSTLTADHLIAATGYHPNVQSLYFLSQDLRSKLRTAGDSPILSRNFESSVPGLYFVGPASANSFGPVARFAFGAKFTARRLTRHLAPSARRSSAPGHPVLDPVDVT